MLVDFRHDLHEELGDIALKFMYHGASDLRDNRITHFLSHPDEREHLIKDMQALIQRRFSFADFLKRACRVELDALEHVQRNTYYRRAMYRL